ncbi:MAG TPA: divalent-cation tolerance protein CutA [Chthoniobacteraceae bacterium]|jgi:periplasmic divalent cation tolerance protein
MSSEILLVISTWPDLDAARRASRALVEEQLAACANIVPGVESIYRWKGEVETANEVIVLFKTTTARYSAFEQRLCALHSYEVPEIVAFSPAGGLPAYLQWVEESCTRAGTSTKLNRDS